MYLICKKINLVLEHPMNFCCKRLPGKAFATMSWRWVSESVTIYIASMMHVKFMLVPMKAMPVALWRTKYVITGCLELWAEIKQIIIDIRSLLFTHSNTETGWGRLVARNCALWKRALITAAWGVFGKTFGLFPDPEEALCSKCAESRLSITVQRSFVRKGHWKQLRPGGSSVTKAWGLKSIVQFRVCSLNLSCGNQWKRKVKERKRRLLPKSSYVSVRLRGTMVK